MLAEANTGRASLENLVESGDLGLQILHPGGLALTRELAELCHANPGKNLLDVASGTGESACFLAEQFGCQVTGIDHSVSMVQLARHKARNRNLNIQFEQADAHRLPFEPESFDVVISECATCALNKTTAIREMVRVAREGGYVGISDLCWKETAPLGLKSRLVELEGEQPETAAGWAALFRQAGLHDVRTLDRSESLAAMSSDLRKDLGVSGYLKLVFKVLGRWGITGLARVMESERIFRSQHLGYAIIVGRRSRTPASEL